MPSPPGSEVPPPPPNETEVPPPPPDTSPRIQTKTSRQLPSPSRSPTTPHFFTLPAQRTVASKQEIRHQYGSIPLYKPEEQQQQFVPQQSRTDEVLTTIKELRVSKFCCI